MVELEDTLDSGSSKLSLVRVQISLSAPKKMGTTGIDCYIKDKNSINLLKLNDDLIFSSFLAIAA